MLSGEVKVYPNNIEFENTDGLIVNRGERVKVESITEGKDFSKVSFSSKNVTYELFVQSNKKKIFEQSFKLAFSPKPIKESLVNLYCESKMKTRDNVLKCLGFPLRNTSWEENGVIVEKFYYTCWFLNKCISYDTFWITFKDGKIDDISGTI